MSHTTYSSALMGEVINNSSDDSMVRYRHSSSCPDVFFVYDEIHEMVESTVEKIIVHKLRQGGSHRDLRTYRVSTPVDMLVFEWFLNEPTITLWNSNYWPADQWLDSQHNTSSSEDACIDHINRTINSCVFSNPPEHGLLRLIDFQSRLGNAIDRASRCSRLLAERLTCPETNVLISTSASWAFEAIELERQGKQDQSLDLIFDSLDELLLKESFVECNNTFHELPTHEMSNAQLLTVLTATLPAKEKLTRRSAFFRQVYEVLKNRKADVEILLRGLE